MVLWRLLSRVRCRSKITRDAFEGLCKPMAERLRAAIAACLRAAERAPGSADFVEIVGGSTRVRRELHIYRWCHCIHTPSIGGDSVYTS